MRDARQELVAELAAEGMSTRAIAPIVGVSVGTVHADRQVFSSEQVTPAPQTMMRVNPDTGEVEDVPARHITGIDGKGCASSAYPGNDEKPHPLHECKGWGFSRW